MKSEQAMVVALQALEWLARDEGRLTAFLTQAGMVPSDLAAQAAEPDFLAALLDFLLSDEASVLAFAHDMGFAPTILLQARSGLPGGQLPHWT